MQAWTHVEFTTTNGTFGIETTFVIGDTNLSSSAFLLLTMRGDESSDVGVLRISLTKLMHVVTTKVALVFDDADCVFCPTPPQCGSSQI